MKRLLLLLLLIPGTAFATDYYVGATTAGAANCLTSAANNCLFATAYALVSAGDTIHMADGTYTGDNSMINCSSKSGTAGNLITVQATNDGGVMISGEHARLPLRLFNCDYWHIDGIDFEDSSDSVITLSAADNNLLTRLTAANASPTGNSFPVSIQNGSSTNWIKDVAALGTGRKTFSVSDSASNATFTRVWGQFESTQRTDPKTVLEGCYESTGTLIESSILEWNQQAGTNTAQLFSIAPITGGTVPDSKCFLRSYGNIYLVRSGKTFGPERVLLSSGLDEVHFTNDVAYLPPDQSSKHLIDFLNIPGASPNSTMTGVSLIGGDGTDSIDGDVVQTNVQSGATENDIYGAETLWVNDGTKGAEICTTYENGSLTAEPLFTGTSRTWPMNQRIIDIGGPDVTAWLELTFGAIPAECGDDATPPEPPTITVTSPASGATVAYGDGLTINWDITGDMIGTGSICYLINGQEYTITTGIDLTLETYGWSPVTIPVTTSAAIRVKTTSACDEDAGGAGDAQDDSDTFTVKSGSTSTL